MSYQRIAAVLAALAPLFFAATAHAQPASYVAATWSDDSVHLLDSNLQDLGSFAAGATSPNGIATDGSLIYTGHFSTQEVVAYDFSGVEQFRWSAPVPNLQGMELVNGELAIYQAGVIDFYNPATGALIRSIPSQPGDVEGLAFDGVLLWQLGSSLYGTDPADGSLVTTIPNAASACTYAGTGLAASNPGELTLACDSGQWFKVSSATGSVITSGNNGLDMYGLKFIPPCGNGSLDAGEQCDDGNTADGDCCSSTCQYEPNGSACPADGNVCTDDVCDGAGNCGVFNTAPCDDLDACTENDSCDGAGACVGGPPPNCDDGNVCTQDSCDSGIGCVNDATPATSCRAAGKSILQIKNNAAKESKDKLTFKWLKGAETTIAELGNPTGTTDYTLCLYAGTASASITIPAGSSWQPMGTKGFKFKDKTGTPDGAQKAVLKSGADGKAKTLVKGKGVNLPDDLPPPLPLPVTAQLVNGDNGTCFEAVYGPADVIKNDAKQFKAKKQ